MTVVFEVLSPKNKPFEMVDKQTFYEEHGVEEYYLYDPEENTLAVFLRRGDVFRRVRPVDGFVSPRLGIRFRMTQPEMTVDYPDGRPFLSFAELDAERRRERLRANQAEKRAGDAEKRAGDAERRAARLAELSRMARHGQASPQELAELERLEQTPGTDSA